MAMKLAILLPPQVELDRLNRLLEPLAYPLRGTEVEEQFCIHCGAKLSIYNLDNTCRPCQEKHALNSENCGLPYGNGCHRHDDCFTCPERYCRGKHANTPTNEYWPRNALIKRLFAYGLAVPQLVESFGLTDSAIRGILRRNGKRYDRRA